MTDMIDPKKELEEFVYIVSHDLNAPFRHIREFTKLLVEKIDDRVTDEERQYIHFIEKSISKADLMLAALHEYSRLNTVENHFETFDCEALVKDVVQSFDDKILEEAKIEIFDLPSTLAGDKKRIRRVFQALIDNALKFRQDNKPPAIQISSCEKDSRTVFSVSDNGAGIKESCHEKAFAMFSQLQGQDKYEGTGSGLAVAKKIITLHGGEIWIEPKKEEGTTISFTL